MELRPILQEQKKQQGGKSAYIMEKSDGGREFLGEMSEKTLFFSVYIQYMDQQSDNNRLSA